MIRKKQKLYTHQRQKIKNNCTHKGVPQGRNKLHCGTPFLMVEICLILAFITVYLLRICVQNLAGTILILEGDSVWAYCFMVGCFESMDFCVSHTCFISFFTSSTSAL